MRNFPQHLKTFFDIYKREDVIELYNEFSVYFRLGNHLEQLFNADYKIHFIRYPEFFGIDSETFVKTFIDIVVFDDEIDVKHALEVVYIKDEPRLEKLFEICTGLRFMEELVENGFDKSYVLLIADLPKQENNQNHYLFEGVTDLEGAMQHPYGDIVVELRGSYTVGWIPVDEYIHYAVIPVSAENL